MARGWESKDIESQMADATEARQKGAPQLTQEQVQTLRERDALLLHRTRVVADLNAAVNPGYREILQRSLRFLDEKLASLDPADRH